MESSMKLLRSIDMSLLWISYLLLSLSTNHINGSMHVNKRSTHEEKPHKFESYGECNRSFINSFSSVIVKTMCKPRPMAVDIISPSSNILVIPSKVLVNRCDGMCHAKQSCLATEKKTIQIMVQQMNLLEGDGMPQCGVVHVEEHIRCKCKCTVMKEDCNEKQEYQAGECMCFCMNAEERRKCIQEGKTWDDEKCSCMCPVMKECTTPYVWLQEYCRCAKLMGEEELIN